MKSKEQGVKSLNGLDATTVRLDLAVRVRAKRVTWDAPNARYQCDGRPVNGTQQRTLSALARKKWISRSGSSVVLTKEGAAFLTECGR
jgi:hypothetical protein